MSDNTELKRVGKLAFVKKTFPHEYGETAYEVSCALHAVGWGETARGVAPLAPATHALLARSVPPAWCFPLPSLAQHCLQALATAPRPCLSTHLRRPPDWPANPPSPPQPPPPTNRPQLPPLQVQAELDARAALGAHPAVPRLVTVQNDDDAQATGLVFAYGGELLKYSVSFFDPSEEAARYNERLAAEVFATCYSALRKLHAAGISYNNLSLDRLLRSPDAPAGAPAVKLFNFTSGEWGRVTAGSGCLCCLKCSSRPSSFIARPHRFALCVRCSIKAAARKPASLALLAFARSAY
jgi:hypothetical protein